MRNLVYAINLSLDGRCDHAKFEPDEETMEYFTSITREADTFVYGRKTYELMIPYWPDVARKTPAVNDRQVDIAFARAFDAVKKILVFSKTLASAEEDKIKIVRDGLREQILALKLQSGKNIMTGGVHIPSQLAELNLVDEFHFVVHPIVAGEGPQLLGGANLQEKLQLQLVSLKTFQSGVIALHYVKK